MFYLLPLSKRQLFIHRIEMIINLNQRISGYLHDLLIHVGRTTNAKDVLKVIYIHEKYSLKVRKYHKKVK